ncbi:hypothetical protein OBBRIDRAFT_888028 [Obba rivulosa]|uniref:Uncharacterized protein n=1 Tax=Obba rivulosa TaxID=1052685 RepID=A0A8E2DNJ6_9APHY|nr:hypothetical protein OBBRIDRAFT_888028 [Obba rivulosa]
MAIMEPNNEQEILRIWSLLTEVSEQLAQNRNLASSLRSLTDGMTRFNLDKPKDMLHPDASRDISTCRPQTQSAELYDAELERMNNAMSADNQALQNDNRQLNALIRECEQALEKVMDSFRTRAYEIQEHELSLMRTYESAIVQRETEMLSAALDASNARGVQLARLGRLLRAVMRKTNGEDVHACEASASPYSSRFLSHDRTSTTGSSSSSGSSYPRSESAPSDNQEPQEKNTLMELEAEIADEDDPDRRLAAAEWSLERECELARLQRENDELLCLLRGVLVSDAANATSSDPAAAPSLSKVPLPPQTSVPAQQPVQEGPRAGQAEADTDGNEGQLEVLQTRVEGTGASETEPKAEAENREAETEGPVSPTETVSRPAGEAESEPEAAGP